jgi:hypothetical protein
MGQHSPYCGIFVRRVLAANETFATARIKRLNLADIGRIPIY